MDESSGERLVSDASVLLNFLHVDRLDLLLGGWQEVHLVEEVDAEVTDDTQRARLQTALYTQTVQIYRVTDINDLRVASELYDDFGLGRGEAFSFVAARTLGAALAIDDHKAIKRARALVREVSVVTTAEIMIHAIKRGQITVEEADAIKSEWQTKYRFTLKFASFHHQIS